MQSLVFELTKKSYPNNKKKSFEVKESSIKFDLSSTKSNNDPDEDIFDNFQQSVQKDSQFLVEKVDEQKQSEQQILNENKIIEQIQQKQRKNEIQMIEETEQKEKIQEPKSTKEPKTKNKKQKICEIQNEQINNIQINEEKDKLNQQTKKIKKQKKKPLRIRCPWTERHVLLSIQKPELNDEKKSAKKFKVKIYYKDDKDKKHACTIRFGSKNGGDYIDHHSDDRRAIIVARLKNYKSVFDQNYWRILLCNTELTMQAAWNKYISQNQFLSFQLN